MFIGHFGVGLAAKKIEKKPSLGTLFLAAQFIDLLWPIFLILGIEQVKIEPGNTAFNPLSFVYYPFTHSLIGVIVWAVMFGIVYFILRKNFRSSVILGLLVISHWILDLITHIPDLPLFPWTNIKVGFGLWNSVPLTIIVEGAIFFAGVYFYLRTAKAVNRTGIYSFWSLIIFLVVVYVMNIIGPPPPDAKTIGYVGLSQWLIIAWGYWIDKNRTTVV